MFNSIYVLLLGLGWVAKRTMAYSEWAFPMRFREITGRHRQLISCGRAALLPRNTLTVPMIDRFVFFIDGPQYASLR